MGSDKERDREIAESRAAAKPPGGHRSRAGGDPLHPAACSRPRFVRVVDYMGDDGAVFRPRASPTDGAPARSARIAASYIISCATVIRRPSKCARSSSM